MPVIDQEFCKPTSRAESRWAFGEDMNRTDISGRLTHRDSLLRHHSIARFLILAIACTAAALGEDVKQLGNSPVGIRVTHLLGFEGARNNANGTLTIVAGVLRFQKEGKSAVEVKIASVQDYVALR